MIINEMTYTIYGNIQREIEKTTGNDTVGNPEKLILWTTGSLRNMEKHCAERVLTSATTRRDGVQSPAKSKDAAGWYAASGAERPV
jgi:hypothetical protein